MAMQSWFSSSRKWIFNLFFSNYDDEFVVSLLCFLTPPSCD